MELAPDLHAFPWRDPRVNNCNTYLVAGKVPLLVDPGHGAYLRGVVEELALLHLTPGDVGLVLLTHGHPDHLEGAAAFSALPSRIAIHEEEARFIGPFQDAFYRAQGLNPPEIVFDMFLREGDLHVGEQTLRVLHTPGHSPGSVCVYWAARKALFTGDLLFPGDVGRTDLPGGDARKLKESILHLAELDVEWMLPGHGSPLRGAEAFRRNLEGIRKRYLDYL